jgi:predicted phosphoribosyltransferase
MPFHDRAEAGRRLAKELTRYKDSKAVVLAFLAAARPSPP